MRPANAERALVWITWPTGSLVDDRPPSRTSTDSSKQAERSASPHITLMPVNDTSAAARDFVDRRFAEMTLSEKAERVRAITLAANQMALAGVRLRFPDLSEGELLLELAKLRLGDDLVARVYGPARSSG